MMKKQAVMSALLVLMTVPFLSGAAAAQPAQKSSGPQLVKDVDNAARQPWAADANITLPPSSTVAISNSVDFAVPADKRLVIEGYSGDCTAPEGIYFHAGADVTTNGVTYSHVFKWDRFPYVLNGSSYGLWIGTGGLRLYADPGSIVRAWVQRGAAYLFSTTCGIALTGYLVDIP